MAGPTRSLWFLTPITQTKEFFDIRLAQVCKTSPSMLAKICSFWLGRARSSTFYGVRSCPHWLEYFISWDGTLNLRLLSTNTPHPLAQIPTLQTEIHSSNDDCLNAEIHGPYLITRYWELGVVSLDVYNWQKGDLVFVSRGFRLLWCTDSGSKIGRAVRWRLQYPDRGPYNTPLIRANSSKSESSHYTWWSLDSHPRAPNISGGGWSSHPYGQFSRNPKKKWRGSPFVDFFISLYLQPWQWLGCGTGDFVWWGLGIQYATRGPIS